MWFSTCQIAVYLSNSEDLITRCFILGDNLCLKHTQAINFHKLLNFITILLCMPRLKAECTAEKHLTPVVVYDLKKLLKFVVTTSHRYIQDEFPWKSCLSWPFLVLYFFWSLLFQEGSQETANWCFGWICFEGPRLDGVPILKNSLI